MLKKAGNIVLILLLLIATGGLPVTRHYCGPVHKTFAFYATPKACCEGSCNKCHNVYKFTKINDNFEAGFSINTQLLSDAVTLHTNFYIDLFNSYNIPPATNSVSNRAASGFDAGHAPASLGNFRC